MAKKNTVRMSLEVTPEVRRNLELMSEKTGDSLSQIVRRSVAIYGILLEETGGGGKIVIRNGDDEKEVLIA